MRNISQCYWELLYNGKVSDDEDLAYEYNKEYEEYSDESFEEEDNDGF